MLTDNDNRFFVILFDKTGDPCECSVHKVTAVGEGITLEVHDKITGENYTRSQAAMRRLWPNPVWLNDILEAMTNIFHIKEDNVICCKCGSRDVTCEAMINPNTKDFDHYTDDSFQYGWCDNCKSGTVISDTSEVKKGISQKYKEFKDTYNTEPQLALCRIIWKDDMKETEVSIALEKIPEEHDDAIFFYCDSLSDFMALAEYGGEDFMVTECLALPAWEMRNNLFLSFQSCLICKLFIYLRHETGTDHISLQELFYGLHLVPQKRGSP